MKENNRNKKLGAIPIAIIIALAIGALIGGAIIIIITNNIEWLLILLLTLVLLAVIAPRLPNLIVWWKDLKKAWLRK